MKTKYTVRVECMVPMELLVEVSAESPEEALLLAKTKPEKLNLLSKKEFLAKQVIRRVSIK